MAIYCHPWDSLTSEKPWNLELLDWSDLVFRYARLRGPHFTEPGCVVCSLINFFPSFPRCSRLLGLWHRNPTDQQQRLGFAFILWNAIGVVKCHPSVSGSVLACMCVCVCRHVCDFWVGVRGLKLRRAREPLPLGVVLGLVWPVEWEQRWGLVLDRTVSICWSFSTLFSHSAATPGAVRWIWQQNESKGAWTHESLSEHLSQEYPHWEFHE